MEWGPEVRMGGGGHRRVELRRLATWLPEETPGHAGTCRSPEATLKPTTRFPVERDSGKFQSDLRTKHTVN